MKRQFPTAKNSQEGQCSYEQDQVQSQAFFKH